MAATIDSLVVSGSITVPNTGVSEQTRATILAQDANTRFPVLMTDFRVHDAMQTVLPGTAASDDLALIGTAFGTTPPLITAGDCKALGATTRRARVIVPVPECYDAAQTLTFILLAGMQTTVADTTCTVDIECYEISKTAIGISADLCTTSATTINSLTLADKTFTITATTLAPGDLLDVRVSIACNDAATGTAVTPTIAGFDLVCDIRG